MQLSEPWRPLRPKPDVRGKYAYVITLWGASADYLIGAMVLGHSLKRTGSTHSRVCCHTEDVPPAFIRLLSALWECRLIEHVPACTQKLSFQDDQPHRFDKVFTKLRVLALTDFAKVLMMDIDLIVLGNIDELFELQTPAALRRGMNDTRWPLKTGDPIEGRPFFGGRASDPKWSWGQGTGINAGVMLLQPDQATLDDMLTEIMEPNHPSHCRGNGPEQDYLSRYWADAPWQYIGVEYNFQLHQMFFALHPNWASNAERADFFRSPEKIKVVHFSGVPAAKPWHRVLDEKFSGIWPDRSRDDEYTRTFADEFLGHWLWIKKDPATWAGMASHHGRAEMQDLYLGEDGNIWKKPWNWKEEKTKVDVPQEATQGAMNILTRALGSWFDCFEELEQSLGTDLKRDILAAKASMPPPPVKDRPADGTPDTGGTDNGSAAAVERVPPVWLDKTAPAFSWKRAGGWWTENSPNQHERLTVVCSAVAGRPFVSFCEGSKETFSEQDDPDLSGLFVKIAGSNCARRFSIPALAACTEGADEEATEEMLAAYREQLVSAIDPIKIWADGVPIRAAVLVAMVRVPPEAAGLVLAALAPLGVPALEGSSDGYQAFAAVGHRPEPQTEGTTDSETGSRGFFDGIKGNARPNSSTRKPGELPTWSAAHASKDVAYASVPQSVS